MLFCMHPFMKGPMGRAHSKKLHKLILLKNRWFFSINATYISEHFPLIFVETMYAKNTLAFFSSKKGQKNWTSSLFPKINDAVLWNFDMNNNGVLFLYWPHLNQWMPPWRSQLNAKYAVSGVRFQICLILQHRCKKMFSPAEDQAVNDWVDKHQKMVPLCNEGWGWEGRNNALVMTSHESEISRTLMSYHNSHSHGDSRQYHYHQLLKESAVLCIKIKTQYCMGIF